jgi:general secretion pathway protein D
MHREIQGTAGLPIRVWTEAGLREAVMAYIVVGGFRRYILLALIMSAGLWLQACATTSQDLEKGKALGYAGDWDKSVQVLQEAQKKNPSDPQVKLLLTRAKTNASLDHMTRGEVLLKKGSFDEAIREFRLSIGFNPGNVRAEVLLRRARAFRQSDTLFRRGEKLLREREYAKARTAFLGAVRLNPENKKAEKALDAYRKEVERPPRFRLKPKSSVPVSLRFKKTPITSVFEVLSRLAGINFIFDKDVQETKVTLFMTDVPIERFLEVLLQTNGLTGKLVDNKTMIIYPDTPAKIKDYEDLQIRTFYLSNLDVKKAVALLSKILKSKDIIANEELNALVIRGPKQLIEVASKLIEANDRPPAEVLLNVEILEVGRSKERQLGLDVNPSSITFGIGESSPQVSADSVFAPNVSAYALGKMTNKELLINMPLATLNILKQDADTRTLANPQIRIRTGGKASFLVGERVPLQVNRRIDTTGAVTTDYQYQDVGIKVNAEPVVNQNDEVSLKLGLEVSTLGANVGTVDQPEYSINTRKTDSVLTMRDGEPVIIGGLISDEERKTVRKIPLLGDIPVLGYLFSNLDKSKVQTDVLMAITPVIIRAKDIPGKNVSEIWSGKENQFSLKEPYASYAERTDRYYNLPKSARKVAAQPGPKGVNKAAGTTGSENMPKVSGEKGKSAPEPGAMIPVPPAKVVQPFSSPEHVTPARAAPITKKSEEKARPQKVGQSSPGPEQVTPAGAAPISEKKEEKAPPQLQAKKQENLTETENRKYFWPDSVRYSIHVNSFPTRMEAQARLRKLSRDNYHCFLVPVNVPGMGFFYRVFVGRFSDYQSALSMCASLKEKKGFTADIHVADRRWAFGG